MTHSPGPWTKDDRPGYAARTIYSPHRRIALALYDSGSEDPEIDDNAALIAAAPEMYRELKELANLMDDIVDGRAYTPDSFTTQPARIAIAKAEGGADCPVFLRGQCEDMEEIEGDQNDREQVELQRGCDLGHRDRDEGRVRQ